MKLITRQTHKIFWEHARRYKWTLALMIFAMVAATIVSTIVPLYYKQFFDVLTQSADLGVQTESQLLSILIIVFILHSLLWLFYRIAYFGNTNLQSYVMADLMNTCFEYLHQHSYRFFSNRFTGALVRKVNRLVDAFEGIYDRLYWDLLPLVIRLVAILIVLFYRNITIALLMLAWMLLYMACNYAFTMYKLKYDEESAAMNTEVNARLADTVTNNVNIKLFSALGDELRGFQDLTEKQRVITRFAWHLGGYMEAFQAALMVILEFVTFYIAIGYWQEGRLTVGDFVLLQDYLNHIFTRLWDFGRFFRDIYKHLANAEEMVEILNEPHEVQDKPQAKELQVPRGQIEFRDVDFTYTKTRNVVQDFNLTIAAGQKVGLVGPSGAGKSTLTALLLRFFDPERGGIYVDGQNIADVTQASLRRLIALVPQDPILFHRSLLDNIRYGRLEATDEEVMEAARLAHCDEFIERLPEGYQTFVGERGIKLSGGERQRVAIARAILKSAPILLLDEATSSLDSHSETMIQDALATLMKGKTAIVIAHRLSTIMKMDRIIVLKQGNIYEDGTHAELIARPEGLYKKLWHLQAGGFIA